MVVEADFSVKLEPLAEQKHYSPKGRKQSQEEISSYLN